MLRPQHNYFNNNECLLTTTVQSPRKEEKVSEIFTLRYQPGVNKKKEEILMIYFMLIAVIYMYYICMHALLLIFLLRSTNAVYKVPVNTPLTSSPKKFREEFLNRGKSNV